jgi:hypothetical protein
LFFYFTITITNTDECTIKKSDVNGFAEGFGYNTFSTVQNMCTDCSDDGVCDNMIGDSVTCTDGYAVSNDNGNDNDDADSEDNDDGGGNSRICKLFKQASKEIKYAKRKKQFTVLPIIFLMFALAGLFLSSSYTYFVRHRGTDVDTSGMLEKGDLDRNNTAVGFTQMS